MNARQIKQADSFRVLQDFFKKHEAQMVAVTPGIAGNISHFNTLYNDMFSAKQKSDVNNKGGKKELTEARALCEAGLWKYYLAVMYRHASTDDELTLINIRTTQYQIKLKNPVELEHYAQELFDLFVPADYASVGFVQADIDALKQLFSRYIIKVNKVRDARITKKLALHKAAGLLITIEDYLHRKMDNVARISLASDSNALKLYNNARYKGIISPTRGNPDKKGKLGPGQTIVLDKHTYRTKKAIIVVNTGKAPLKAGIGLTATAFTGTPFTIEPGKMRQRISQKLATAGEYILLQNIGDVETKYKVWMGE